MKGLTERQREILDFIAQFCEDNSYSPTVREIGLHFKISIRAVQDHIIALQKKGYIVQTQHVSRSIRIIKDLRQKEHILFVDKVPLVEVKDITRNVLAEENVSGYINIPEPFVRSEKKYFAFKVQDDSMKGAGILAGDIAVVEYCESAENGQIAVVVHDNRVCLRKYFEEDFRIRLQSENPEVQSVFCQNVVIYGILVSIIRTYVKND
ncbi:transcriptional repressor LexA [Treponema sp.]|uniref:transcriptional repressor LexA n=1 Tax=Treponema sp. TaxID=166 RepID=UPI0025EB432B|nr:transcriptional repressor LexA [Treponema sp.]MCR5218938.1 transcriptional repressor LexA [Treponema sp.]